MMVLCQNQEQDSFGKDKGCFYYSVGSPISMLSPPEGSKPVSSSIFGNSKKPEDEDQHVVRQGRAQRRRSASESENDREESALHQKQKLREQREDRQRRFMLSSLDCDLSIPTSTPFLSFNESSADGDNDSLSGSSLVSEVTMMTYSKERANMIKEEFFGRIRQETKSLSLREKKAQL